MRLLWCVLFWFIRLPVRLLSFLTISWRQRQPDRHVLHTLLAQHKRSTRWPAVRRRALDGKKCAVCGSKRNLTVHHIKPYHLYPELELDESNLIVLCEGPVVNCHFLFGHLRNWKSYNPDVVKLVSAWQMAIDSARLGLAVVVAAV